MTRKDLSNFEDLVRSNYTKRILFQLSCPQFSEIGREGWELHGMRKTERATIEHAPPKYFSPFLSALIDFQHFSLPPNSFLPEIA